MYQVHLGNVFHTLLVIKGIAFELEVRYPKDSRVYEMDDYSKHIEWSKDQFQHIHNELDHLEIELKQLEVKQNLTAIKDVRRVVCPENKYFEMRHLHEKLAGLEACIQYVLNVPHFFYMPTEQISFYTKPPLYFFGENLPAWAQTEIILGDMKQGLHCLAFGQSTAAVFYFCRILESIVKDVIWVAAGSPGKPKSTDPELKGWGAYEGKIRGLLYPNKQATSVITPSGWTKKRVAFFDRLLSQMGNLRRAERNVVMHAGDIYDYLEAVGILGDTKKLLRQAALQINDRCKYTKPKS